MEVTMTELFLFGWAMVATILHQQVKGELRLHRGMTGEVFRRIAEGRIKVRLTEDSFELEEVRK